MSLREAERDLKKALERVEKEKKKISKQRRIRTVNSRIVDDEELELELARLERETVRKSEESGDRRKLILKEHSRETQILTSEKE